jgi:hypothetical protein
VELLTSLRADAIEWCRGKNWLVRLPLLLFFVYALIRHLSDPLYTSILSPLNLGIHELGHLVFGFMGQFLGVAGGTLLQLAIPVFAVYNFYRQRDFFAIALSFGWLSTNFFSVATYAADARRLELPLVTPFGTENVVHDWEYLLSTMNILVYDSLLGSVFRVLAVISMMICFALGAWILWQMSRSKILLRSN